jgi:hypothetical protein
MRIDRQIWDLNDDESQGSEKGYRPLFRALHDRLQQYSRQGDANPVQSAYTVVTTNPLMSRDGGYHAR